MSVLTFKPHKICFCTETEGTYDEDDNFVEGSRVWGEPIACDLIQADGKESTITLPNGEKAFYTYVAYLPTSVDDLSLNDIVRVQYYDGEWREYSVKGYKRYQLQCKAWLSSIL